MPVTKQQIDYYFSVNYDKMLKDTTTWVAANKQATADAVTYISNAYEYVLTNKDKIPTLQDIGAWTYRIIIQEVRWTNSRTNKENADIKSDENYCEFDMIDFDEIEDKIELEANIELKSKAIQLFKEQATKEDKIILQVYIDKNIRTVRGLAKHLNIKNTQAWVKLKEIKNKIKEIHNEIKN